MAVKMWPWCTSGKYELPVVVSPEPKMRGGKLELRRRTELYIGVQIGRTIPLLASRHSSCPNDLQ